MRFASTEGELSLLVAGYQLEMGELGDGVNCLHVDGTVNHPGGDWGFRGKYCSMDRLYELGEWLEAVAADQRPDVFSLGGFMSSMLTFAVFESELRSEYSHDPVVLPSRSGILRITFGDTAHPPWHKTDTNCVFMDFLIAEQNLSKIAAELREQLRSYPPR